ncbi:MAG: hypothetical protein WC350_05920, partial [Candidatus Micrarchaeia archaeon]
NNTADYAGGSLGAGEVSAYYAKLSTKVADATFDLKAACTFYCGGEVDDFTMEHSGWNEVTMPAYIAGVSMDMRDDTNVSTTCTYKHCYEVDTPIRMNEWDSAKYKFVLDTDDSTGPTANGDSYFGAVFLDSSWELNNDGDKVLNVWYKDGDGSEDPSSIGLDEQADMPGVNATNMVNIGLDTFFTIEPQ